MNSNSGSEFDKTSIDSFMEDQYVDGKHESSIMKSDAMEVPHASLLIKHRKIPEESESAGQSSI